VSNPEDTLLAQIDQLERDLIDELVDHSLATPYHRRSGYDNDINQDRCGHCLGYWHGLTDENTGCPGAFATDEQIAQWHERRQGCGSGYFLADVEGLRGGFANPYREYFQGNVARVRFWVAGPDGWLNSMEGELRISQVTHDGNSMTVEASMGPPIVLRHQQAREQSIAEAVGPALEDADLAITAQTWIPGQEGDVEPEPVSALREDAVAVEAAPAPHEGFLPIGYCAPHDFELEHTVDYVQSFGGQTMRTAERYTASFTLIDPVPSQALNALLGLPAEEGP